MSKQIKKLYNLSEVEFLSIINTTTDGFWINDMKGNIIEVNSRYAEIIGYTRDELLTMKIPDIEAIEKPEETKEHIEKIVKTGYDRFETKHKRKDGKIIDVEVSVTYLSKSDEKLIVFIRDITEAKKTAEELRSNKELLELFFAQSINGFFFMMLDEPVEWNDDIDKDKTMDYVFEHHRITKINQAMLDQYKAEEKDFIGLTPNVLFKHDIKHGKKIWKQLFDTGRLHVETDERKFDGTPMSIIGDYILLYNSEGKIIGHFGVQDDITESKNATYEIKFQNEFQKLVSKISSEFIKANSLNMGFLLNWMLKKIGLFFKVERAFLVFYTSEKPKIKNIYEWCAENITSNKNKLIQYFQANNNEDISEDSFSDDKKNNTFNCFLKTPIQIDNRRIGFLCIEDTKNVISDKEQFLQRLKIISNIITEAEIKVNAEKEIIKSKENAEMANKAKTDFLSTISHEIRTPMNAIVSMSHFLEKTNLSFDQNGYVEVLKNSSENLMFLIEQILDISKLESSSINIENNPIIFRDIINKTISIIELKIKEKGLIFEQVYDENIPEYLLGDELRIEQILLNILSNAVKFTDEGKVSLEIKVIETNEEECKINIIISDTGIGIEKKDIVKVFDKFYQLDSSISRKYGGSGLGLYITKELLNLMNGDVRIEKNYPKGTKFNLIIPLKKSNKNEYNKLIKNRKSEWYETVLNANNYKILAAEDDKINQFILKSLFKDYENIEIVIVKNGIEAVEHFKKESFDLILMDINMPEMDGITAIKIIRGLEHGNNIISHHHTPIMVFTATTIEQLRSRVKDLEINGYIIKPLQPQEFYNKISSVLNIKRRSDLSVVKFSDDAERLLESEKLKLSSKSVANVKTENKNEPLAEDKDKQTIASQNKEKDILSEIISLGKETVDVKEALKLIDNELELYEMILNQFIQDYGSKNSDLMEWYELKKEDKLLFIFHKLVTAASNIGAYKLSKMSKQMEDLLNSGLKIEKKLFTEYCDEFIKVIDVVLKIIQNI